MMDKVQKNNFTYYDASSSETFKRWQEKFSYNYAAGNTDTDASTDPSKQDVAQSVPLKNLEDWSNIRQEV
jgi:hypothetical protein